MVISGCSKGSLFLRDRNCLAICWINSDGSGGIAQFAMLISLRCLVSDHDRLYMFKCFPRVSMSPVSYVTLCPTYVTRVLISQGAMSPRIKCSTDSMCPMLYAQSCPMFTHVLCSIMYYVPRVLCPLLSYVPRVLCYPGPNFPGCYAPPPLSNVPLILCSTSHMFPMFYVIFQGDMRPVFNVPLIIYSPVTYVPRDLCSPMFPRVPMFMCSMLPRVLISQGVFNVPLVVCSPCYMFHRVLCSPRPYVPRALNSHSTMFPGSLCSPRDLCSPVFYVPLCSMFPRDLCSPRPKSPGPYVPL